MTRIKNILIEKFHPKLSLSYLKHFKINFGSVVYQVDEGNGFEFSVKKYLKKEVYVLFE